MPLGLDLSQPFNILKSLEGLDQILIGAGGLLT